MFWTKRDREIFYYAKFRSILVNITSMYIKSFPLGDVPKLLNRAR